MKNLEDYINLNWTYQISKEENAYYVVRVKELPGVCTDAESIEEGMVNIKEAMRAALSLYLKNGEQIPLPPLS